MEVGQIDFDNVKPGDFQVVDPDASPAAAAPETPAPAAAQTPETPPPAAAAPETPAPAAATPETPTATAAPPAPAGMSAADWKALLKEQGFNDDFIKLADFAKTKGDLTEYLKVKSTDYKGMDALDLIRIDFDERYPTLTAEEREVLWDVEVVEKYHLDRDRFPETDRAAQAGLIKMKLEADKIRQSKVQFQESFGVPSYEDPSIQEAKQAEESIKTSPEMTALLQSKTLPFQVDGKSVFNFRVENPEEIGSMFTDPAHFANHAFEEDGSPRVQRMFMAAAVLKDPLVIKRIFEAGVAAGRNNEYEAIEDASPFGQSNAPSSPEESLFDAFKNRGRLVEPEG